MSEQAQPITALQKTVSEVKAGSVPDVHFVTDPEDEVFRYLILPTVQQMKASDCRRLTIELHGTTILFEALS